MTKTRLVNQDTDLSAVGIDFTPDGSISATNVQAAIVEVRDEASGSGISQTIVDAKGDLIVATAADTVARQAVGTDGHVLTADSSLTNGIKWAAASGSGITSGTSFPGSPTTNDLYRRTDLRMIFFYDGTRWLSEELYRQRFATTQFVTATVAVGNHEAVHVTPGSDIWLETFVTNFYVNPGGTALGASHKWVGVVRKNPNAAATTIATVNIDSGASDTYRSSTVTINALLNNGTTHYAYDIAWTKTGTPGALLTTNYLTYRIVAT